MDIQEAWEKALKNTEVIRPRVQPLQTFGETHLPYIFLAESSVNLGDTVKRQGEIVVEKPSIILPPNIPQFEGFQPEGEAEAKLNLDALTNFLFVRGVKFPSLKYNNKTELLEIQEGRLKENIEQTVRRLEQEENVSTGLVIGPEDCWQFSLIIFIASQILRQASGDIKKMLDDFRKQK